MLQVAAVVGIYVLTQLGSLGDSNEGAPAEPIVIYIEYPNATNEM